MHFYIAKKTHFYNISCWKTFRAAYEDKTFLCMYIDTLHW